MAGTIVWLAVGALAAEAEREESTGDAVVAGEVAATLSLPGGGLGAGPGLRLVGEHPLAKPAGLALGAEADLRLPSAGEAEVSDPAMAEDADIRYRLTLLGLGARVAFMFGEPGGLRGRVGLAAGVGLARMVAEGPAGDSIERATTVWLRPQGGVLVPAGPGDVTFSLLVGIAPARMEVADGPDGGVALAAGYRLAF